MSSGVRDIRSLYPRITENHLRYLGKWGLIRPASQRGGSGEFSFHEIATIKQLSAELERRVPLKHVLRVLLAEHQGQMQLDFHASGSVPAKVVSLPARHKEDRRHAPDRAGAPVPAGNGFPFSDPQA